MHSNSPTCSAVSPPNCTTPGVVNGQVVDVKANWVLPDDMTRHEGGANPEIIRILRVRGESMLPDLSDSDRLAVDTAR